MKKRKYLGSILFAVATLSFLSFSGLASTAAANPPKVLFLANSNNPGSDDRLLIAEIEEKGFEVVLKSDEGVLGAEEVQAYHFVWVSATVDHRNIDDSFADLPVPIGTNESRLYVDLGLASTAGQKSGQRNLKIASGKTISVAKSGQQFGWGKVSEDASILATISGQNSRAAVFTYSKGAALTSGALSPQCRAGFFAGPTTPDVMRPAGFSLFADLVDFLSSCARPNTPPTIDDIPDRTDSEGDEIHLEVAGSDADNDGALTYASSPLPAGLSIDSDTGLISGVIGHRGADSSPYQTSITVTDSQGGQASAHFQWVVIDDPLLTPPAPDTPNVLVIMTDDQTVEQMRWLPGISAHMAAGTHFANSITNYPLCGPSRATFLTGQYASNHSLDCNPGLASRFHRVETDSLAPWISQQGVHTIHVGKYLNGYGGKPSTRYIPAGWDDWRALAGSSAYNYTKFKIVDNGIVRSYGFNGDVAYSTDVLTDHLDEALRAVPDDKPFMAVFTPLAPHFQGGKKYAIPAPRHQDTINQVLRPLNYDSCLRTGFECPVHGSDLRRAKISNSAASVIDNAYQTSSESLIAVDEAFQTITATLEDLGRLDSTVIIFTSDNGFSYGEHGIQSGKRVPTRESLFVPLYISGPGFDTGSTITEPVVNADLAPTIVDIFDAEATLTMDGQSLLDPLSPDRAIFFQAKTQPGTNGYEGVYADGWLFIDWLKTSRNDLYAPGDVWQLETLDNDNEWNKVEQQLDALTHQLSNCSGTSCKVDWVAP